MSFTTLDAVPDIEWSADRSRTALAWEPFSDVASSIAALAYCWGTRPFTCDVVSWTPVALTPQGQQGRYLVDSATAEGLNITAGTTVFGTVAAVNNVGLVSLVTTNGVTVDDRPPAIDRVVDTGRYFLNPDARTNSGTIMYRSPVDIDCDAENKGVGASWRDVAAGAGVGSYAWSVGTCAGCGDILGWTDVGQAVAVFNETLRVPAGFTYFASVRATGVTGATVTRHSDGVRVLRGDELADRMVCVNV